MSNPIVIVGSGLAAYTLAREFRKLDQATPLTLITRDQGAFYSKPMLSNALSANKLPAALILKNAAQMACELGAEIIAGQSVASIGVAERRIQLADGRCIAYRDLVLAQGADSVSLPLQGNAVDCVISVNDLDDFTLFSERMATAKTVAILGAGLIGCEFANDLLSRQIRPVLIDSAEWPLSRLLPQRAGAYLDARLRQAGVEFRGQVTACSADREGDVLRLALSDGSYIDADIVLSAVGLQPRTALAAAAGAACGRGIIVNRRLASTLSNVYALGDCAEVMGYYLPFVMPIMHQAKALARTLNGDPTDLNYPAMPVVVKTPACPTIVCPPPAGGDGEWLVDEQEGGLEAGFYDAAGSLLGFALLGAATIRRQALLGLVPAMLA
ncbi:NAD(P)/FAD-dependent oxidoreductase [Ferribacterium limneticum]|uniref:NAD(P)/FAD-dependent oxidoreductase n=1 Tax=Ferribacterium limneticum TaxID=76259 RepID=UPI001CF896A7|nr:FAD-dependent oxidoreductase [Ferribacterium limneticum]UCV23609.1 FAD-dependent oxidoreductase [Ferribacterium limneticum]